MIDQELIEILWCPETNQKLALADPSLIASINQKIKTGEIKSRSGKPIREEINSGLVREDKKYLYPIRSHIPILLIDEAIPL